MLVLSRHEGEHIWIGENIRVTVLSIQGGRVRLGVQAPTDVPVFRHELRPPPDPASRTPAEPAETALH